MRAVANEFGVYLKPSSYGMDVKPLLKEACRWVGGWLAGWVCCKWEVKTGETTARAAALLKQAPLPHPPMPLGLSPS